MTHGNTFTSEIGLPAVLEAIKQSAFVNSEYPVILSIENHLNTADQALMAQQMRHILGDLLDTEAIPPDAETFPSPSERLRKIFIKAKIGKKVEKEEGEEGVSRKGGKQEEKILLAIMKTQTSEIGNKITKTVRFLERCVLTKHEKVLFLALKMVTFTNLLLLPPRHYIPTLRRWSPTLRQRKGVPLVKVKPFITWSPIRRQPHSGK